MSKTRAELGERVLKILGIVAAGQEASTEDAATADDQIEPVLAELSGRRIVYVADYSTYEDDTFNPIAECIAVSLAAEFGADLSHLVDPITKLPFAEDRLRKITRQTGTGKMLKTNELTGLRRPGTYWYDWTNS
jgi:hypothetical protein